MAATTEPCPWMATSVFKLIAVAKINRDRNTTLSLRDIVPSEVRKNLEGV